MAEYLIKTRLSTKPVVLGENAPNSGHTCSKGKTRNIPASAFFADSVFLGPDSVIDPAVLISDMEKLLAVNPGLVVYIHEFAARCGEGAITDEKAAGLVERIGSTVTGGGSARSNKQLYRSLPYTIGSDTTWIPNRMNPHITIIRRDNWLAELMTKYHLPWVYEGSQGMMLDVSLGYYPFVTSRSTHPMVALYRNGFMLPDDVRYWEMVGTFRTYPIRTGGNSGPTGGAELSWNDIGVPQEVATVTGRVRRVFGFSSKDFFYSTMMQRPEMLFFTHADYVWAKVSDGDHRDIFLAWLAAQLFDGVIPSQGWIVHAPIYASSKPGEFVALGTLAEYDNRLAAATP